jgi:hypothetical protein
MIFLPRLDKFFQVSSLLLTTLKGKVQSRSLRSLALHLASGVPEVGAFGSEER